jgi:lipopolysaccharide transport system ATP-binding protein
VTAATLQLDGVWKAYPRWPAGGRTLRGIASRRVPLLARRGESTWALRDISLEVRPGRSVGLIGRNGAGKSTLLRLAAGLSRPTRGTIAVPRGAASVLSLGDTFDFSLTGRENALTAAIMSGWGRRDARKLMGSILEFAELEEFADAPVRTYSEGMKLRLAFAVVAQLEPSVLLLDEVIAVGDVGFQAKCTERIAEMRARGAALVLASHDLEFVEHECDQALWLEDGGVAARGDADTVVGRYRDAMRTATLGKTPASAGPDHMGLELGRNRVGTQEATIDAVSVRGRDGGPVESGGPVTLSLDLNAGREPLRDPIVTVSVARERDDVVCLEVDTETGRASLGRIAGPATVTLELQRLDLAPGRYVLDVGLYPADWGVAYDYHWHAHGFEVTGGGAARGLLAAPHRWDVRS